MKTASLICALLCCFSATFAHAGTSLLTGTLTDAQGNPLNGTLVMQLPMPAQDPATNTLISPVPVSFRVSNGAISGGPPLFDVQTINPTGLYYAAKAYDTAGNLFLYGNYVVTGSTFNLSAAIPTTITTNNVSFLNPVNVNGNNTFSGSNSFTGTTTFSGTQTFTTSITQNVSGTGCTKAFNLLNVDASPANPNKYFRVNQSTGALEIMSNACALIFSLGDNGNFIFGGIQTSYNGVATVGNGQSVPFGQDDQTGLTATRGPIVILTGTVTTGGHWRLCYAEEVTTSDASGRTITFSAIYTSHAIGRTFTGSAIAVAATANSERNCVAMNLDNNTSVSYTVTSSGAFTTAQYAIDVWAVKE
jgi:hypothetical protein